MDLVSSYQRSLLAVGEPGPSADARFGRVALDDTAWVDVARGWCDGADVLLDELVANVPWHQGRRHMYDRVVDDPRLSHRYAPGDALPHPALAALRDALVARYRAPFVSVGLNYYRDGHDSVASHADRELRELDDTLVAVLTLGARRPFLVRPKGRGRSRDFSPATGDLLVMGGTCQRDWEHGVPKVTRAGPRVSVTWRAPAP
jgi:alkylated DNA repair dioxygenase AlkB